MELHFSHNHGITFLSLTRFIITGHSMVFGIKVNSGEF